MTAFDRFDPFDRRIGDALEGIAPPQEVDYLDDLFEQTARTSQRPRWSFPERWFNVDTVSASRPTLFGLVPLRIVVVGALVFALVAAATLLVGSRLLQDPSPPQRNGAITYGVLDIGDRWFTGHIHVVAIDGEGDRVIGEGALSAFTANGEHLVWRQRNGGRIVIARPDGSDAREVAGSSSFASALAVSPDGAIIATTGEGAEISLVDVASGSRRVLVPGTTSGRWAANPTWSPDGSSLAYREVEEIDPSQPGYRYSTAVDVVDVSTGTVRRVTSRRGGEESGISWSPDGHAIAFSALPDGADAPSLATPEGVTPREDVFVIAADGTGETNLTASRAFELDAVWSPDGTMIAYRTFADAGLPSHIAIVDLAGTDRTEAAGEPRIGPESVEFVWSPDASSLLFVRLDEREGADGGKQVVGSTMELIEADLAHQPTTVLSSRFEIGWLGWQRQAP